MMGDRESDIDDQGVNVSCQADNACFNFWDILLQSSLLKASCLMVLEISEF